MLRNLINSSQVAIALAAILIGVNAGSASAQSSFSDVGSSQLSSATRPLVEVPAFITIYRNSIGFGHLVAADRISPGSAILNKSTGELCSAGWFFDSPEGLVLSTAGHCGVEGDQFVFTDPVGEERQIGTVTHSEYKSKSDLGVNDFALISVEDESIIATFVPLDARFLPVDIRYSSQADIAPQSFDVICGVGFRSGLSCGPFDKQGPQGELFFRRISDSGDSGGPVFGVKGSTLSPIALGSAGQHEDATLSLNQPLKSKMEQLNLELRLSP